MDITPKDLYDKGSEACNQYSKLTTQVRTMAQHILIGYTVAMGVIVSRVTDNNISSIKVFSIGAGLVLILFAFVLWVLNYHHSTAFRAIRDNVLIGLEKCVKENPLGYPYGPWTAHKEERGKAKLWKFTTSDLAWNLPFIALALVGLVGVFLAIVLL